MAGIEEILNFWFGDEDGFRETWFRGGEAFDQEIQSRFGGDYERAAAGELDGWKSSPRGCLALILLLDQFPRNMFRGDTRAFATDPQAREAAKHAIESGFDRSLRPIERIFVYLPFEHSEDLEDQRRSVELFRALGRDLDSDELLDYAIRHKRVIARFGRFPHRNEVLGRSSTPEEEAFLGGPDAPF